VTDAEHLLETIEGLLGEAIGSDVVRTPEGELRVRLTPWPGLRSFVTLETHPEAYFAPLWKIECSTLVGRLPDLDADISAFLDAANFTAVGGSWQVYLDGNVGITGQVLT